jgi:methylglutaconyl-CoA hydratase
VKDQVGTLWLNRPEVRNAINGEMMGEIIEGLEGAKKSDIRVLVLRGKGKVFCAGADIHWMKEAAKASLEDNYEGNVLLARCFHAIYTFPKPTLAVVHGAAMGGGNGLLAACDMAYALDDTLFSFSEVRIGIIPATISPYVIKRIGEFKAKELMLTGKRIRGQEAAQLTLINQSFKTAQTMSEYLENVIDQLKENGPNALAQCKLLIEHVSSTPEDFEQLIPYTARMIAAARLSEEGQEGMAAFLEKRKPNWIE